MQASMITKILYGLLALLMVDALIEMSFVAATVAFLHTRAGRAFQIAYEDGSFSLHGKPAYELADQGHVSNGAAGTALVLVGIGGLLSFPFLRRDAKTRKPTMYSHVMLIFWLIVSFLSVLLTLVALIFTFVITARHAGQTIDEDVASQLNNRPYPNDVPYPLQHWTPENWFAAILNLDLIDSSDRSLIETKWHVMRGWRWNLIPMFILGVAVFTVGVKECRNRRTLMRSSVSHDTKDRDLEYMEESQADTPMLTPVTPVTRKPLATQQNVIPTR